MPSPKSVSPQFGASIVVKYNKAVKKNLVDKTAQKGFEKPGILTPIDFKFGKAPVDVLIGIGPKSAKKLLDLNIYSVGQLAFTKAFLPRELVQKGMSEGQASKIEELRKTLMPLASVLYGQPPV